MVQKYSSGKEIRLYDKVKIGNSLIGDVIGVIDSGQFDESLAPEAWLSYGSGVLVMTQEMGLILYSAPEDIKDFVRL